MSEETEDTVEAEAVAKTAAPEASAEAEPVEAEAPAEAPAAEAADEPAAAAEADEAADEPAPAEKPAAAKAEPDAAAAAAAPPAEQKKRKKRLPRALRKPRSKPVREKPAERKPVVRLAKPERERGRRQERQGTVVSDAMDKTIVVKVDVIRAHPRYQKVVRRSVKFHAHDENNEAKLGDVVRIVETRPLSATKRWRLAEIIEVAK